MVIWKHRTPISQSMMKTIDEFFKKYTGKTFDHIKPYNKPHFTSMSEFLKILNFYNIVDLGVQDAMEIKTLLDKNIRDTQSKLKYSSVFLQKLLKDKKIKMKKKKKRNQNSCQILILI